MYSQRDIKGTVHRFYVVGPWKSSPFPECFHFKCFHFFNPCNRYSRSYGGLDRSKLSVTLSVSNDYSNPNGDGDGFMEPYEKSLTVPLSSIWV